MSFRARATLRAHLLDRRSEWSAGEPSPDERRLLASFIEAHERGDAALAVSIAAQDLRITMPPAPMLFEGLDAIEPLLANAFADGSLWRLGADRRQSHGDRGQLSPGGRRRRGLRVVDGRIAEITTFGPNRFAQFGLPETLEDQAWPALEGHCLTGPRVLPPLSAWPSPPSGGPR